MVGAVGTAVGVWVRVCVRAYAYVCRHLGKYECVYPREPVRVRKIFAASRCV